MIMAAENPKIEFSKQISETRKTIKDKFKKSHEALVARENILLARVDSIENEYNHKVQLQNELIQSLQNTRSFSNENLKANQLTDFRKQVATLFDSKITELSDDTDTSIELVWDILFESDIEQLGSIKLNDQTSISPTRTFPPQVKPVVPDYKVIQQPIAYRSKKSSAPGELTCPRGVAVHYLTGNIYIADEANQRVQVFSNNGDYIFKFCEKMNQPRCICISKNTVLVTQYGGHCVNKYELRGKLIKSFGSNGNGEGYFNAPLGVDVSDINRNIYVCDYNNKRVQILTEELQFHSILGLGIFTFPCDVKVTRDKVLVLDQSDPCMFIFSSKHTLTNRLISRGVGKQTNNPYCFDIDRDYNIIMSDINNCCVYVFNSEGEQINKFGKQGQGIGEFSLPYGIALDNSGHIIVVCQKNVNCLQFF